MKRKRHFLIRTALALFMVLCSTMGWGQTSVQNFGTGTGTHTSTTGSLSFIPNPTSGTTYARGGGGGTAPINLATASNPLGTADTYVRAVASTSTSVAKFSPVVGYTESTEFYTSFKVLFGTSAGAATATSGSWTFYQGGGSMYTSNGDFAGAEVFTGLRFNYAAGGVVNVDNRTTSWTSTGISITQGVAHTIEIVGNNASSGTINYSYNGVNQSVAFGTYDFYVDGVLVGNDLQKGGRTAGAAINSTTFIGISSTSNVANIFVDDVVIYNDIPVSIGTQAKVATPTISATGSPNGVDTFWDTADISLATTTPNSTIYYTVNGGPTLQYLSSFTIAATSVIEAYAEASGLADSDIATKTVTITPTVASFTTSPTTITGLNYGLGNGPSVAQSFTLEGANLDNSNVTLTAPANFEISQSETTGYANSIILNAYDGTSQTVWVRLAEGLALGSYAGDVSISGGGVATALVLSVSGDVLAQPSVTASSQAGTVGTAFNYQVNATENPDTYALASGSLPAGLSLNTTTGIISGTPTSAGTFTANITATNAAGTSAPAAIDFTIGKGTQTATLNDINAIVGASAITLPATTDAGLTIMYSSNNTAVADVTGNTLTIGSAGSATITATVAETADYFAFNDTFMVNVTLAPIVLAGWDFDGIVGTTVSVGATTYHVNLNTTASNKNVTRGAGAPGSSGSNSFRTQGFKDDGISVSNTDYFQHIIKPAAGYKVNLANVEARFAGTATFSASPGVESQFAYSLNGTDFTLIGSPFYVTNQNQTYTVDLSSVSALQNITSEQTVYLRYYASGRTSTGGWGYSSNAPGTNGLAVNGFVSENNTVWDGNTWSNGTPSAGANIIFSGNYNGNGFNANNITVSSGAALTITSTETITAANITVEDNANFIQEDGSTLNLTGTMTLNKNATSDAAKYVFWSSPVMNQNVYDIYPAGTPQFVMTYNSDTDLYPTVTNPTAAVPGVGYSVKVPVSAAAAQFTGAPNSGDVIVNLDHIANANGNTWNLIGNPYPSNLNLQLLYNGGGIGSSIYFWDNISATNTTQQQAATTWAVFNAAGGTWSSKGGLGIDDNSLVKPGQGFIVQATAPSITFTNAMRSVATANFINKGMNPGEGKFWLKLATPSGTQFQTAITYGGGALNTLEAFDSKVMSVGANGIYSYLGTDKLAIQGRDYFVDTDVVILGNKHSASGQYTFSLAGKTGLFDAGQAIYLKDKQTNIYTNLQTDSYTFLSDALEQQDRFEIVYQPQAALGTSETVKTETVVYKDGDHFTVKASEKILSIEVYDASGRHIGTVKPDSTTAQVTAGSRGMYLLKIKTLNSETVKKVMK